MPGVQATLGMDSGISAGAGRTPVPPANWTTSTGTKAAHLPGAGLGKGSRKVLSALRPQAVHPLSLLILHILWPILFFVASSRQSVSMPWRTRGHPALAPPKLFMLKQHLQCRWQSPVHLAKVEEDDYYLSLFLFKVGNAPGKQVILDPKSPPSSPPSAKEGPFISHVTCCESLGEEKRHSFKKMDFKCQCVASYWLYGVSYCSYGDLRDVEHGTQYWIHITTQSITNPSLSFELYFLMLTLLWILEHPVSCPPTY